jgi:5-enolpyruvylshikimate-3-phosphate synthase
MLLLLLLLQNGFCSNVNTRLEDERYVASSITEIKQSGSDIVSSIMKCYLEIANFGARNSSVIRDYSVALASLSAVFLCIKIVSFCDEILVKIDDVTVEGFRRIDSLCDRERMGLVGRWVFGR